MTQVTYLGKTAGGILKTARIVKMQAGNKEIKVTLPNGKTAFAALGERSAFGGGTIADVLVLFDADRTICRLTTSSAAYAKLRSLENDA